jgi:hypothetical protein
MRRLPRGTRDALVEVDLDSGMELVEAASGKPVAAEPVRMGEGYRRVRFLAEHVPALGYRVYRLKASTAGPPAAELVQNPKTANTIENEFYRVTVDPGRGGVTSIFDKQIHREIVDARSPYLLNQYLYVSGGDGTRLIYMRDHLPNAELTIHPASGGTAATARPVHVEAAVPKRIVRQPEVVGALADGKPLPICLHNVLGSRFALMRDLTMSSRKGFVQSFPSKIAYNHDHLAMRAKCF